jgi:hypothetical protein
MTNPAVCRYRLVVDESYALGVLGVRGRGACEAAGLHPGDAEIVAASLGAPSPALLCRSPIALPVGTGHGF